MATGTNGIATNQEIYNKCAVWVDSSQPSRCPTYSQIIGQRLSVNGSYLSAQLVMLYDIYAPSYIRLYIDDWDTILGYCGMSGSNEAHWNFDIWGQHPWDYAGIIFNETPCTYEEEYCPYFEASLQTWIDFHEALNMAGDFSGVTLTCGGADYVPNDLENFEYMLTTLIETGEDKHMNWMGSGDSGSSGGGSGPVTPPGTPGYKNISVTVKVDGYQSQDGWSYDADPLQVKLINDSGESKTFTQYMSNDYETDPIDTFNFGSWNMPYSDINNCKIEISHPSHCNSVGVFMCVQDGNSGALLMPIISADALTMSSGFTLWNYMTRLTSGNIMITICPSDKMPLDSWWYIEDPWVISTKNPDKTNMICFESDIEGQHNHIDKTIIHFRGNWDEDFYAYIRSYAESTWDFMVAGQINSTLPTSSGSYSGSSISNIAGAANWTRGEQNSGETISSYKSLQYHTVSNDKIEFVYRKDSSSNIGDDKGYLAVYLE